MYRFITFTLDGQDEPFFELPSSIYRLHESSFNNAITAALEAGQSLDSGKITRVMNVVIDQAQWYEVAVDRYGKNMATWRFVCPACGYVASVQDYRDAGVPETAVASHCIGRYTDSRRAAFGEGRGPCDYAGGDGLFSINPVTVVLGEGNRRKVFDFADRPLVPQSLYKSLYRQEQNT
jgi:hypothetical protein